MDNKKIFIYSVPRPTASNIGQWRDPNTGLLMKKTKIGRSNDRIQALYSSRIGGLLNGLSYKQWTENGKPVTDKEGNNLTLQHREEQRWNLPKDYLHNRSWRRGDSVKETDMSYFQRAKWTFNDGCTIFDLNNFEDAMGYYVALDSKLIANSEKELRAHK